ncbi:hypothetical protein [Ralstonia insidiosa]|uniref:hypothetical protein n=1 Tax=Ralstonia insidiosa TaxID=190721 RepID=UPI000CEE8FF0|nr:hypothetical protein [Ralstonia insidiosa]
MPLNPNIPLQVAAPVNPLMQVAQVAQLGGSLLQQQALSQQIGANVAASQAFKDSTDPTTGAVDYGKLSANLAQGPGAYNLPTIMGQALDQQKKRQDLTMGQWELAYKQQDATRQALGGLLATPNFTQQDVINTANGLIQSGALPRDQATQVFATMPSDPSKLRDWVIQHAAAADKGAQLIAAVKPTTQVINNGAGNSIIALNPMTGQPTGSSTFIPSTLTPAEAAARVPTFQNGQPGSVPMGSLVPGTPGYGGGPAGGMTGAVGSGAFLPTGPKLGQEAASAETGQLDAKAADAAYSDAQGAPTRILQLQTGLQALQNITTGPNQDRWNQFKTIVGNMPGIGGMVDMNKVKDFDEFHKIMTQYATNQMASMGNGSDSKLAAAVSGNPNDKISNLANDQILRMNIELESYRAAMTQAFQASGAQPGSFRDFQTRWNAQVDPRAFVASQMSDADLQRMYSRMSPAEQSKFNQTWALAEQKGWLTPQTQTATPTQPAGAWVPR